MGTIYTYDDLITEFRDLMRDPSTGNNKLYTDTEILRWAVDATTRMINMLGLYRSRDTFATVADQAGYNLTDITGASTDNIILKIYQMVDANSKRIWPTTIDALDHLSDSWRDDTGTPRYYYPLEGFNLGVHGTDNDFGLYKIPDAVQNVTIYFWRLPNFAPTASTSKPEMEDNLVKSLMPAILARGYEKKRDFKERDKQETYFMMAMKTARKMIYKEQDGLLVMGSNEHSVAGRSLWRPADGYPPID